MHPSAETDDAPELRALARSVQQHAPPSAQAIDGLIARFDAALARAAHPLETEQAAEAFAHDLRALWLRACAALAADTSRTPTEAAARRLAAASGETFGYERDFKPEHLEARCDAFFPPAPSGWRQRHLLFASGQAAMTAALLSLDRTLPGPRPLRIAHLGGYFETCDLVGQLPGLLVAANEQPNIVILEPVACDGQFRTATIETEIETLVRSGAHPSAVIIDPTLTPSTQDPTPLALALEPAVIISITSGLKLLQSGFELSNVGILSVMTHNDSDLPDRLIQLRTLTGGSLAFIDALALEAPWFLDRKTVAAYEAPVFAHNAALARAVAANNQIFEPAIHPSLTGAGDAPYCVFRLREPSEEAYANLEARLARQAAARRLLFEKGGSFGFRAHRYEVVRPENSAEPFLRVAMGRRGGWSCEGVIGLMAEIARG